MSDPSNDNPNRRYRSDSNAGMWAGILLAAFVIVIGLIFLMPKSADNVATSPGASTTGSAPQGTTGQPARTGTTPNPTGTGPTGSGTAPSR